MQVASPIPCYSAWHPPPSGAIKSNIDVAFFTMESRSGIGLVVLDSDGDFLRARTMTVPGL